MVFFFNRMKSRRCLPAGTVVDSYRIEKALGSGGFSAIYLALEQPSGGRVIIKEYMPPRLARRLGDMTVVAVDEENAERFQHGRLLFFREAGILATLVHPNIVRVLNFFRANGTVYLVMPFEQGRNLQNYIQSRRGYLSERFLRTVFTPLLDALRLIHSRDLLHLDIKPGNIHLRPGGSPLLLDFGALHRRFEHSRLQHGGQVITAGFSPIEQYDPSGYVGPWTDIYALGATLRACIEGRVPPPAPERYQKDSLRPAIAAFKKHYSESLLKVIDWALEIDPLLRPQRVDDMLAALGPVETASPAPARGAVSGARVNGFHTGEG